MCRAQGWKDKPIRCITRQAALKDVPTGRCHSRRPSSWQQAPFNGRWYSSRPCFQIRRARENKDEPIRYIYRRHRRDHPRHSVKSREPSKDGQPIKSKKRKDYHVLSRNRSNKDRGGKRRPSKVGREQAASTVSNEYQCKDEGRGLIRHTPT